jgi:hypothetical protein
MEGNSEQAEGGGGQECGEPALKGPGGEQEALGRGQPPKALAPAKPSRPMMNIRLRPA